MSTTQLRIIAFGAHPDDCDILFGGTAAKYLRDGHAVKFVSLTNGNAGHHRDNRDVLKQRRAQETQAAAAVLGIEYEVLDFNDGELLPSMSVREEVIRRIRQWRADLVFSHRPNDYHPDHRYTGMTVQDAGYMVCVPLVCPDTPVLKSNPYFFYFWDHFHKPNRFHVDITVGIDETMDLKWRMLHCHTSQVYEWLPYLDGEEEKVPSDDPGRLAWLKSAWTPWMESMTLDCRELLHCRYGNRGDSILFAEAFEICEYGKQPTKEDLKSLFPI